MPSPLICGCLVVILLHIGCTTAKCIITPSLTHLRLLPMLPIGQWRLRCDNQEPIRWYLLNGTEFSQLEANTSSTLVHGHYHRTLWLTSPRTETNLTYYCVPHQHVMNVTRFDELVASNRAARIVVDLLGDAISVLKNGSFKAKYVDSKWTKMATNGKNECDLADNTELCSGSAIESKILPTSYSQLALHVYDNDSCPKIRATSTHHKQVLSINFDYNGGPERPVRITWKDANNSIIRIADKRFEQAAMSTAFDRWTAILSVASNDTIPRDRFTVWLSADNCAHTWTEIGWLERPKVAKNTSVIHKTYSASIAGSTRRLTETSTVSMNHRAESIALETPKNSEPSVANRAQQTQEMTTDSLTTAKSSISNSATSERSAIDWRRSEASGSTLQTGGNLLPTEWSTVSVNRQAETMSTDPSTMAKSPIPNGVQEVVEQDSGSTIQSGGNRSPTEASTVSTTRQVETMTDDTPTKAMSSPPNSEQTVIQYPVPSERSTIDRQRSEASGSTLQTDDKRSLNEKSTVSTNRQIETMTTIRSTTAKSSIANSATSERSTNDRHRSETSGSTVQTGGNLSPSEESTVPMNRQAKSSSIANSATSERSTNDRHRSEAFGSTAQTGGNLSPTEWSTVSVNRQAETMTTDPSTMAKSLRIGGMSAVDPKRAEVSGSKLQTISVNRSPIAESTLSTSRHVETKSSPPHDRQRSEASGSTLQTDDNLSLNDKSTVSTNRPVETMTTIRSTTAKSSIANSATSERSTIDRHRSETSEESTVPMNRQAKSPISNSATSERSTIDRHRSDDSGSTVQTGGNLSPTVSVNRQAETMTTDPSTIDPKRADKPITPMPSVPATVAPFEPPPLAQSQHSQPCETTPQAIRTTRSPTEDTSIDVQVGNTAHAQFEFEFESSDRWPNVQCSWFECPLTNRPDVGSVWPQKDQCTDRSQADLTTCVQRIAGATFSVRATWKPMQPGYIKCQRLNDAGETVGPVRKTFVRLQDPVRVEQPVRRRPSTSDEPLVITCWVDRYTNGNDVQLLRNGRPAANGCDGRIRTDPARPYTVAYELRVAGGPAADVFECVVRVRQADGAVKLRTVYRHEVVPFEQHWPVVAAVVGGLVVLLAAGGVGVYVRGHQLGLRRAGIECFDAGGDRTDCKPDRPSHEQAHLWPYDRSFEFPLGQLRLSNRRLGAGAFGVVYRAKALGIGATRPGHATTVAVKMAGRTDSDTAVRSLIAELKIMARIGQHRNVLRLLGAVTSRIRQRQLYVISEFCELGNLQTFLRAQFDGFVDQLDADAQRIEAGAAMRISSRGDTIRQTTSTDLLCWSLQAARGMTHLVACGILHGDLAARNCLLNGQRQLKIADFGLSRRLRCDEDYQKTSDDPLPVKWMAIEAIRDSRFNTATDVWSFGVLLWELFSLAAAPYAGMPNVLLLGRLLLGHRMQRPPYATHALHALMAECWSERPADRPDFGRIERRLGEWLPRELRRRDAAEEPRHAYTVVRPMRRGRAEARVTAV